jgi:hypothetical protein
VAALEGHRLRLRVEDQAEVPAAGLLDQLPMPFDVLRLDHEAKKATLADRDQLQHLPMVVEPDPHEEGERRRAGARLAWAGQLDHIGGHGVAPFRHRH